MTTRAAIKLAIKALESYATTHWGWSARYHSEDREKYEAIMMVIGILEEM